MSAIIKVFPNKSDMIDTLAQETAKKLAGAIADRGTASYVAAGGTTVPDLFDQLSQTDITWQNVQITLSDERWVHPDNTKSNQNMVTRTLLQNNASAAHLIPLWHDCPTPGAAAKQASLAVKNMPAPFDVTLLGMGKDMHAASLFPDSPGLAKGLDLKNEDIVCEIGPVDGAQGAESRLSLTLRAILASRSIYIMITGEEKWAALNKAMFIDDPTKAPVSAILNQALCPVYVYWTKE